MKLVNNEKYHPIFDLSTNVTPLVQLAGVSATNCKYYNTGCGISQLTDTLTMKAKFRPRLR
jgi:hypothetical protein